MDQYTAWGLNAAMILGNDAAGEFSAPPELGTALMFPCLYRCFKHITLDLYANTLFINLCHGVRAT